MGLSHTLEEVPPRNLVDKTIDMRSLKDPLGLASPVAGLFVIQDAVETFLMKLLALEYKYYITRGRMSNTDVLERLIAPLYPT